MHLIMVLKSKGDCGQGVQGPPWSRLFMPTSTSTWTGFPHSSFSMEGDWLTNSIRITLPDFLAVWHLVWFCPSAHTRIIFSILFEAEHRVSHIPHILHFLQMWIMPGFAYSRWIIGQVQEKTHVVHGAIFLKVRLEEPSCFHVHLQHRVSGKS